MPCCCWKESPPSRICILGGSSMEQSLCLTELGEVRKRQSWFKYYGLSPLLPNFHISSRIYIFLICCLPLGPFSEILNVLFGYLIQFSLFFLGSKAAWLHILSCGSHLIFISITWFSLAWLCGATFLSCICQVGTVVVSSLSSERQLRNSVNLLYLSASAL